DVSVNGGDLWSVTLNGHEFTYVAQSKDSLSQVAKRLSAAINAFSNVYTATPNATGITIIPDTNAWFTGITTDVTVGGGVVRALFDIDYTNATRSSKIVNGVLSPYNDSLYLQVFDAATGQPLMIPGTSPQSSKNTGVSATARVDAGSNSHLDPFLPFEFDTVGEYIVRVGSYRHYDDHNIPDEYSGVIAGVSYQLNVSLQRHKTNTDAIELVGKQITIVDGVGVGQTGTILAYDAKSRTYTVDRNWATQLNNRSKFEIEYYLREEFNGYAPVGDSYSVQLTTTPTAPVTIDVHPQITRTYNSSLAFVAEANYGESAGYQVTVATPQVVVELRGTPVANRFWTLTLNDAVFEYEVQAGDDLIAVARALATLINGATLNGAETFVATVPLNGTHVKITSSRYDAQINDAAGTAPKATSFTTEFSVTQGDGRASEAPGAASISDRDAVSGWLTANIELTGTAHAGSSWTLRLDGKNYTYAPTSTDTLNTVAAAIWSILPAVYKADAGSLNGAKFTVSRTDGTQFRVSFTVLAATQVHPQLVFTSASWDLPQDVKVWAVDDSIVDGGDAKVVAAVESRVNVIRGPLTINGSLLPGVDRSLNNPFLLPDEKNNPIRDGQIEQAGTDADGNAWLIDEQSQHVDPRNGLVPGFDPRMNDNYYGFTILDGDAAGTFLRVKSVDGNKVTFVGDWPAAVPVPNASYYYAPINPNVLVDESDQVDSLIVDNSDSPSHDTGVLTGTRLTGLGMGPDTVIGNRTLAGGISYLNLEVLKIALGVGNDRLTIESTHAGTTTVDSGAGNDVITVQNVVGHTFIESGAGTDEIVVSSRQRLVDEIGALLTVIGGAGDVTLQVDDTADSKDNQGILTPTTLTGLDMPGVPEIQTVTVLAAGGTYRLSHAGDSGILTTAALSYDATATELQIALNSLLGSTGIRVEKFRDNAKTVSYQITFGGDLVGRDMAQFEWAETISTNNLIAAT
ncbi:MAG: hypothetical protein O2856_17760, partial [Planctomycetota bacterium]|nr:hypothetical protein [Planctomycetota bacterium]